MPSEVMAVQCEDLEQHVVERVALTEHEGKSGAGLERLLLDDGRRFVLKRCSPRTDLVMALTGDTVGREYLLWSSGVLDRLPSGTGHAIVGGWPGPDGSVLLMRDLGTDVLTWSERLDAATCRWVLARVARMHDTFLGLDPATLPDGALTPPADLLGLFAPARLAPHRDDDNQLPALALHGWEVFDDLVPDDVASAVTGLLADIGPLVDALTRCPATLVHGDLATVNLALEPDLLTLIDWSMPALLPGAMDIARFLAGCSSVVDLSREEVLTAYRDACGASYDEHAMRLALLGALLWLGWNKALDAAEHPDPAMRLRERADLDWWLAQARLTLDEGL